MDTKSNPRYTIHEQILANGVLSDLTIKETKRNDSALFTCIATNAFGSDDTSINMIVQGQSEIKFLYNQTVYIVTYICIILQLHKMEY